MDYKRKPLTSYNQIPQQNIKKRENFIKNNCFSDYKEKNEKDPNEINNKTSIMQDELINNDEDKDSRIISFNCQPPSSEKEIIRSTWTNLKPITIKDIHRNIPNKPERVLDAPNIGDEFYSELLDWSINNKIAIALDSVVYVWNANNGNINTIGNKEETGNICSLKWSNDGNYLGIGTNTGETQIWDTNENKKLRTLKFNDNNSAKIDLTSRSPMSIKKLKSNNLYNKTETSYLKNHVGCISWNNSVLTSAFNNGVLFHNDVRIKNSLIRSIKAHDSIICGLKWRSDGEYLASGSNDNTIKLWDLKSSKPYMVKTEHNAAVKAIAWCPWQLNLLATGGGIADKTLRLWNITTQSNLKTLKTESQITSIIWSYHYSELLTTHGYSTNDINVWRYPTMDCISNIKAHESRILYSGKTLKI